MKPWVIIVVSVLVGVAGMQVIYFTMWPDQRNALQAQLSKTCVHSRLDVKREMVVTRYGCEEPRKGRWRDAMRAIGGTPPP